MADTAIKTEEGKQEFFDSPEDLDKKITELAQLIKGSKHFVAFTGAGLSTGAGIPDYRSGANTIMETGPGCWEKAANIQKARKNGTLKHEQVKGGLKTTISKAQPTKGHMSMVQLMNKGFLKYIISQNVDGLHRKSGIPYENIAELHGNTNLEVCQKCQTGYMRDFRVRNAQTCKQHKTGRKCDNTQCKGDLADTIINFGENLNDLILNLGYAHGYEADLMLCLGSSMRVHPAAEMAEITATRATNKGKIVIVNLQKTPLDCHAYLNIHCKIDDFFAILMQKLQLDVPEFKLERWVEAEIEVTKSGKERLHVKGITDGGAQYDLFKTVLIDGASGYTRALTEDQMKDDTEFQVKLNWQGHYNESSVTLTLPRELIKQNENKVQILLKFDPNVANTQLKGIRGNWEEPKAYKNQKYVLGGIKYVQGAGTTAAAGTVLAKQFEKKLNLAPKNLVPKAVPAVARRASMSPNRANVAKKAPVAQLKPAAKAGARVPLVKKGSQNLGFKN